MKLLLVSIAFFSIVLYYAVKYTRRLYKQAQLLKCVPSPPKDSIVFGHIRDMFHKPADFLRISQERYKDYGNIQHIWLISLPFLFIAEASFAEVFFTNKHLQAKSELYKVMHTWLGQGLLTSKGSKWQKSRKLLTPAFHFQILNSFCDAFVDNSLILVEKLQGSCEKPVDAFKLLGLVALDNLCDSAMGVKVNALKNPKMWDYIRATEEATHTMIQRMFKPWYWDDTSFFLLPVGRKMREDLDIINKLNDKIITERKKKLDQRHLEIEYSKTDEPKNDTDENDDDFKGKKRSAFLDVLLEACHSASPTISEEDVRHEVATFMFEGHDTTTSALAFTTWLLGLNPDVQEKCYEELDRIFNGSDRRPTAEDLNKMTYLEQAIKEGLRLFPSVPMLSRSVPCDVPMGKYTIPEGSMLVLNTFMLHRDPKWFPDPEKFDPDRFNTENSAQRHPFAYTPFAAGPRNCIGQKFAMMELKIVISYLIRNFTFESAYNREELGVVFALIIRSNKSLDITFRPRKTLSKALDSSMEETNVQV